jgi:uncharacterized protein YggE
MSQAASRSRARNRATLTALIALSLGAWSSNASADAYPDEPHVVVDGFAELSAVPDLLEMSLSISELNLDVAKAVSAVEERSSSLLAVVKSLGIDAKDVSSSELSITPRYNWNNREQTLVGSLVSRKIDLTLRDLTRYHDLIAALIEAKVGELSRTTLKSSREEDLRRELLQKAVADARRKAELLVSDANEGVGSIYSLSSQSQGQAYRAEFRGAAVAQADQGSFEPGSIELRESIRAIFYLTRHPQAP